MLANRSPVDRAEERLLERSVDPEPPPAITSSGTPPRAADFDNHVERLATYAWTRDMPLIIATDGGSDHGCGSWEAAVIEPTLTQVIGRTRSPMHGEAFTPFAAEIEAVRQALLSLVAIAPVLTAVGVLV